ncbi:MAG: IS91 family transposase [Deltaproteobacteria bacterium]|nr:IS91 family transposase [Deltaproteobacteria bacterium]
MVAACPIEGGAGPGDDGAAEVTLAEVFRRHGEAFLDGAGLPPHHVKAIRAIVRCRTPALGGRIRQCDQCGQLLFLWNSCNDRHCPTCGALKRARWLEKQKIQLLHVPHFQLVFTLDHALNLLAVFNQETVYNLLFAAASETLKEFAGRKGGQPGITAMLHTWDQQLNRHIHLHCLVPAGMLSVDRTRWIPISATFLFPVKALSIVFRAKFLDGLADAHARGQLVLPEALAPGRAPEQAFRSLLSRLRRKPWVVYCQKPLGGPDAVLRYLARYTYGAAISNKRILSIDNGQVTFEYKDRRDNDAVKTRSLPADQFIRRFLLHILPPGFQRIRHFGLFASRHKAENLACCCKLLDYVPAPPPPIKSAHDLMLDVALKDIDACPFCRQGRLTTVAIVPRFAPAPHTTCPPGTEAFDTS